MLAIPKTIFASRWTGLIKGDFYLLDNIGVSKSGKKKAKRNLNPDSRRSRARSARMCGCGSHLAHEQTVSIAVEVIPRAVVVHFHTILSAASVVRLVGVPVSVA